MVTSDSFTEVRLPEEFLKAELRAIAGHAKKSGLTTWYRVRSEDQEVAFVAIERSEKLFFPSQIVIPRKLRGNGIGSAVLREVEALARSEGYGSVRVWPRPIDTSSDRVRLERWYRDRGYRTVADGTGDMEKRVVPALHHEAWHQETWPQEVLPREVLPREVLPRETARRTN